MRADRRHHIDAEAERAAVRDQAFRRAGAALAIGEIVADHDVAGAEALGHDFGGEGLGAQRGQRLVEGNDEGLIEAERLQQLELQRQRRQPEEGRVRREELARMRLEHHRARAAAFLSGDRDRRVEHFLVAAMDAVEIADGKRRALEVGRRVLPAADNVHHGTSISLY